MNPALHVLLEAALDAAVPGQVHLLVDEATGEAYTDDLLRRRFIAVRAAAARTRPSLLRPNLQLRDLRRTFGVLARAGGGLREDVGDVLGNSAAVDPLLNETYMPASFETASRAVLSIVRPVAAKKEAG